MGPDALRPLVTLGPFTGLDASTEPSFLGPGMASDCSNVDVSANLSAFTIANGRTLVKSGIIPAGYYATAAAMFTALDGPGSTSPLTTPIRLLVVAAANPSGETYTCIYNTATGNVLNTTGTLMPFTSAVQFQDGLYTNASQQIRIRQWAGPMELDGLYFIISAWQPSRPLAQVQGTLTTSTVAAGPGPGTYKYAVALLIGRGSAFGTSTNGVASPLYDDTTTQLTAPYYIPGSVTITDNTTAPTLTLNFPLSTFPSINEGGDYSATPVIFRWSEQQPVYYQLPANGLGSTFNDISTDTQISSNLAIESPSIGTPPPFSLLLEQGFTPSGQTTPTTYYDYALQSAVGFCCNHKGRLWAFSLYPNEWDWVSYNSGVAGSGVLFDVQLASQVWWSSVGVPWQFDGVDGVEVVGPEEVVGNIDVTGLQAMPSINAMPWTNGDIEDTPMGMASISSELVLHKSNNIYKVWGDTGAEFTVYPIADIGTVSSTSITPFEGGDGWLAPQGPYYYNGGAPAYVGENVRRLIESLPYSQRQACIGFYRDRTWYLSFPYVQTVTPPSVQKQTQAGSNSGTASIVGAGTPKTVNESAETASVTVTCNSRLVKQGSEYVYIWTCLAGTNKPVTWSVTCAAPVAAGSEITFKPTAISGNADGANLSLIGPNGTTLQTWTNIVAGTTYSYFNSSAQAGSYTWQVSANVENETGTFDNSSTQGTYSITVTPTVTYYTGSGSTAVTNGASTTLTLNNAQAPTSAASAISLSLSSVVAPSDANGTASYTATLSDAAGATWVWENITAADTITFTNASAPPGTYTWTVASTVTPGAGGGSSTYACSCSLSASWYEESGGAYQTSGITLAYYTPTQQWFKFPYAINAACTSDFSDNLAYVFVDSNLYTWGTNAAGDGSTTNATATWTGNVSSGESPGLTKEYRYLVLDAPIASAPSTATLNLYVDGTLIDSGSGYTAQWDLSQGSTAHVISLKSGTRGYVAQLELSVSGAPGTIVRNAYATGTVVRDVWVTSK